MVTKAIVLVFLGWAQPVIADCYDLAGGEPALLEGELRLHVFPGPPNYESVQAGDTPEPAWILHLENTVCASGDEFSDPTLEFDTVQLLLDESFPINLEAYAGKFVRASVSDAFSSHSGHHHAPLLAVVQEIE